MTPTLSDTDLVLLAGFASALSDPNRLRIARLFAGGDELSQGQVCGALPGIAQSTVSYHLGRLLRGRVLTQRRDGPFRLYRLDSAAVRGSWALIGLAP